MDYLKAQRIDQPSWVREPEVEIEADEGGQEAHQAFQPHFDTILNHLHGKLEEAGEISYEENFNKSAI